MWKQRSWLRRNVDPSAVAGYREGQNIHSIVVSTYYAARYCYDVIIIYVSTVEKIAGNDSVATLRFLRADPMIFRPRPKGYTVSMWRTLNTGSRM